MKKSCVFLLVMSIISLLPAAFRIVEFINILHMCSIRDELQELYAVHGSTVSTYYLLREEIFLYAVIILLCLVLVIFGIIGSIKRGRFTVVCMVLGGLPALYLLFVNFLYLVQGFLVGEYSAGFVYCALYTAAAAVAFKSRKAA